MVKPNAMEKTKNPFNPELLLFLFIIMLAMPYMISGIVFTTKMDFGTNTGTLGDTIGGLTAPFIGFLSSILVFYAFREQIKANEIQVKANQDTNNRAEEDNIIRNIDSMFAKITNYYNQFEYNKNTGKSAFDEYSKTISDSIKNLSSITQGNHHFMIMGLKTKEELVQDQVNILRKHAGNLRHSVIMIQLCIIHIKYLDNVYERKKEKEIGDFIKVAKAEFNLFFLNKIKLYTSVYEEHFKYMKGQYNVPILEQYAETIIELSKLMAK